MNEKLIGPSEGGRRSWPIGWIRARVIIHRAFAEVRSGCSVLFVGRFFERLKTLVGKQQARVFV